MDEEGKRMSNYGMQELSPEEIAGQWKEFTKKEAGIHKNHIAIKGDGGAIFRGVKQYSSEELSQPLSYFNKANKHDAASTYDRMFHVTHDYNSKLHRDDRQHTVGLDMQSEELDRSVPVRSSTEYGRYVHRPLEESTRKHARIDKCMKGFYRTRGTGIPSSTQ